MSNFNKVVVFNQAIGNEAGDKQNIDWDLLTREADMIQSEVDELRKAIKNKDANGVRDALCDIHVFAYGTHHKMGYNADADMNIVIDALYSRFCMIPEDLQATIEHHKQRGVDSVTIHGKYPFAYIKSAGDYPDAPTGKFLKSVNYCEPEFNE
ncbi:MAG: nucleoside triphosphate pyrophosphohydrolase family protein [Anaerolineales bacterium]|nr:nucleoside triphosphate pyrophosphohydrolase family protein [Anaerolineales bacterium]